VEELSIFPKRPRGYPVFSDRAINGPIGLIADASCIVAVVAGMVRPIYFSARPHRSTPLRSTLTMRKPAAVSAAFDEEANPLIEPR